MSDPRTVLVVDDSEVARAVVRRRLEQLGFRVHTLSSTREIDRALVDVQPDLLLVDLEMPDESGDEATRRLGARAKVVLHSSLDEPELARRAVACGAVGFIRKTSDEAAFVEAFRVMLERAR